MKDWVGIKSKLELVEDLVFEPSLVHWDQNFLCGNDILSIFTSEFKIYMTDLGDFPKNPLEFILKRLTKRFTRVR